MTENNILCKILGSLDVCLAVFHFIPINIVCIVFFPYFIRVTRDKITNRNHNKLLENVMVFLFAAWCFCQGRNL